MIRAQTLHVTFWLVCLSYMVRLVSTQDVTFPDVPSTPFIDTPSAGNFTWPSGSTGIFDQGTPMRIAWESPYTQINLYLIWNQTVNEGIGAERQKQIGTGIAGKSIQWVVDCDINGSNSCARTSEMEPFVLRAVNAGGDIKEVNLGGFWSREFYINPLSIASATSSSTTSSTTSSSSASSTTASTATSSASSSSTTSSTTGLASTSSSTTALSTSPPAGPTTTEHSTSDDSGRNIAIGVGVGAGVGIALLIGAGAFFLLRRRSRRRKTEQNVLPPSYPDRDAAAWQHQQQQKSEYYHHNPSYSEAPGHLPISEAPGQERQELPDRTYR